MKITFNDVDEFLTELRERGPDLARTNDAPVVRVTVAHRPDRQLPLRHVWVQAGFFRQELPCYTGEATWGHVALAELRCYVGEFSPRAAGEPERKEPVLERAREYRDRITDAAEAAGYQVRAGRYRLPGDEEV